MRNAVNGLKGLAALVCSVGFAPGVSWAQDAPAERPAAPQTAPTSAAPLVPAPLEPQPLSPSPPSSTAASPVTPTPESAVTTSEKRAVRATDSPEGAVRSNSLVLPAREAPEHLDTTPRISGYIQVYFKQRFEQDGDGTTEPNLFRFGRVKVQLDGKVLPMLKYVIEIDPRSPQLAGVIRDAYIQWQFFPGQKLRVGQMKTPFGWENRTSSAELYTVNRTEVGEMFGRGLTLRDLGIGLFGTVKLGGGFRLEDEATLTNGAGLNVQAEDDRRKNVFGRLGLAWKAKKLKLGLGVSAASGTMNEPAVVGPPPEPALSFDFKRIGVDLSADTRYAFAVAEYAQGDEQASDPDESSEPNAWYVLMAGKTPWDVGPVVRYDVFDGESPRWTLGAYYGPPRASFRAIVTYEIFSEDGDRHDDRLLIWSQVRF